MRQNADLDEVEADKLIMDNAQANSAVKKVDNARGSIVDDISEPEDCVDHFKRREIRNSVFDNRANGDDAGFEDYTDEDELNELDGDE